MGNTEDKSFVWIDSNKEKVWNAIINKDKLTQWYAPGSPWEIPSLNVGDKITFTLMPSVHNNLIEKLPMTLTIENVDTYQEFSFRLDSQQILISIALTDEANGTRVTMNSEGFAASLENLKALVEGNELPNT
ncbi:MAG: SRPBCC domain-containing protein [Bacillota bacterium]